MRKLLQNTFFAAMLAWALQGLQAHMEGSSLASAQPQSTTVSQLTWQP